MDDTLNYVRSSIACVAFLHLSLLALAQDFTPDSVIYKLALSRALS